MSGIGAMVMPADFSYREVFLRGKPQHDRSDPFSARHPKMSNGRRAKIFSPFDALKGFSEAVSSKDRLYEDRRELNAEDRQELDRRLRVLKGLTFNSRMARENRVVITVVYYTPCADENSEAFGLRGSYCDITGVCRSVDEINGAVLVDTQWIAFEDIFRIDSDGGVFQKDRQKDEPI